MTSRFEVRRFLPSEADLLRQIRLEGLQSDPEAFGSTHELESTKPPEFWSQWAAGTATFGVFVDGPRARGLVAFLRASGPKAAHRSNLGAMYVAPDLRGTGAATALVEALIAHAATLVEQVHLSVNADNQRAVRFYRRMGFVEYGREPRGLRHAGIDHDVLLMVRMLDRRDNQEGRP